MRRSIDLLFAAALVVAALGLTALQPARAADPQSRGPDRLASVNLPFCEDERVLAQVEDQFEYGAVNMLKSDLTIVEFSHMQERGYLPPSVDDARPIERRWCQARALMSDHHPRTVYYIIEFPMGFAAIGGYVGLLSDTTLGFRAEGCVVGLDRWRIYGAECQSLRRVENPASRDSVMN